MAEQQQEITPDDEGEIDPEAIPEDRPYCWTDDPDEMRRAFVLETMANADIDGSVLVSNMDAVYKWLKTGDIPAPPRIGRK